MTHWTFNRCPSSLCVAPQEISSLVGEVRTEASEAVTVAMVTAAEGEEPMQTDSQAGDAEQPSSASVLQVHVEAGEAAAAQVHTHTHAHKTKATEGDR